MRKPILATAAAAALAIAMNMTPASAQVARPGVAADINAATASQSLKTDVQYRGRRHWRNRARQHRNWRHRRGSWGPAVGAGVAGLIIGGALASQAAQARNDAVAYCMQRFRSYDPASGTYLGYDGYRHSCP